MLQTIKLLINKINDDNEDELIATLISLSKDEAYHYCNLAEYDSALDYIVVQMVIERYNRIGSEGALSQSTSGVSTDYTNFYSDKVVRLLNKHRKVRTV